MAVSHPFRKEFEIPARARRKVRRNIGRTERVVSVFGGAILAFVSLPLRSFMRYSSLLLSAELLRRGISGTSYLYRIVGLDRSHPKSKTHLSERSTTIRRPRREVYDEWRRVERFPEFMENLLEVRLTDKRHSHWNARGPLDVPISWEAEIIGEKRNEFIHWRTIHPSQIKMEGMVFFSDAPQDKGTEVRVRLKYQLPGGRLAKNFALMFGKDPDQQNRENLRHFKQFLETGETPTARMTPSDMAQAA